MRNVPKTLTRLYFCGIILNLFFIVGCRSPKPKAYNFEMILDEGLKGMSVEVNLVGVTELEKSNWEQLEIDEMWNSEIYKNAEKKIFTFNKGKELTQKLSKKDPIWKTWLSSGVNSLFVVGDIPGVISTSTGSNDPRALMLPLEKGCWKGKTIQVEVDSSQVRSLTPIQCKE